MEYIWNEDDFDLDLQIWRESDPPAPPPCLAMDSDELKPERLHPGNTMAYHAQHATVECLFYSSTESDHALRWMGPSPLLSSTDSEPILHYLSDFLSEKVHWLEVHLVQLDPFTRGVVGEQMFFIARIETASWKFEHIRKEIVGIVYDSGCAMPGYHFRLSLWPRVEPFPYSA
ncbi:hypothetical protein N7493_005805 [Penicillium malachiteum]|uniref:Uncharacterized protein n=1 Tax=Penicillium malachiteum TaxID=1324776 RepID=A0AAD6MVR8_9EURO|nr:hypothetical protein N7493_005805 [Penicillium malachiteum]